MATHSSSLAWKIPGTGEPWWAAVYGVAQSWTRLKRLNSSSSNYSTLCHCRLKAERKHENEWPNKAICKNRLWHRFGLWAIAYLPKDMTMYARVEATSQNAMRSIGLP